MRHLKSATEVERILAWRSDDFGHSTEDLLIAESQALQEIGEDYLTLQAQLKIAVDALTKYGRHTEKCVISQVHKIHNPYCSCDWNKALAEIEKLGEKK